MLIRSLHAALLLAAGSVAAQDVDASRAEIARAAAHAQEGDGPAALRALERAFASLEGAEWGAAEAAAAAEIAGRAYGLGGLGLARAAMERLVEHLGRTRAADDRQLLHAMQNLSLVLMDQGELDRARQLQEAVLDGFSKILPPQHPDHHVVRVSLGATLLRSGATEEARRHFESAVEGLAAIVAPDDPNLLLARQNLAAALLKQGDVLAARDMLERVLDSNASREAGEHPLMRSVRGNLAVALHTLGDLARCRVLQEQVLEDLSKSLPPDHPDLQRARLHLAVTLGDLGRYAEARELQEAALRVCDEILPEDDWQRIEARFQLGTTMLALGEAREARALLEQAMDSAERSLPSGHRDVQVIRTYLAAALLASGEAEEALALQERATEALGQVLPPQHTDLIAARGSLAELRASLGDEAGAVRDAAGQVAGLRRAHETDLLSLSPLEVAKRIEVQRGSVSGVLSIASGYGRFAADPGLGRDAFELLEALRQSELSSARLLAADDDPEARNARQALREVAAEIARAVLEGGGRDVLADAVARRDRLQAAVVERLEGRDEARAVLRAPTLEQYAGLLPENAAAVCFWRYSRRSAPRDGTGPPEERESMLAHVVRHDGGFARVEIGAHAEVEAAVTAWHEALGTAAGRGAAIAPAAAGAAPLGTTGEELRRLVVDPWIPAIGDSSRIVVVLDDVLHAVPFDALPMGDVLLGDRFEIDVRLTLRELCWTAPAAAGPPRFVGAGGIDFARAAAAKESAAADASRARSWGRGPVPDFEPLPATRREVEAIAALFVRECAEGEAPVMLLGQAATAGALQGALPGARFLHVATHGWYAPESIHAWSEAAPIDGFAGPGLRMSAEEHVRGASPMALCGLAFAGANSSPDALGRSPGLLTAEEVASWDLRGCELATLSACETGIGAKRVGQGVASLQKALHMAGARTVVTSLWKVPDEATRDLMIDFYRRTWGDGEPEGQALWNAKAALRRERDAEGRPRYATRDWAGWVVTGDAR